MANTTSPNETTTNLLLGLLGGAVGGGLLLWLAGAEVRAAGGEKALRRKGNTLRPSLAKPAAPDLGYRLGYSRGLACWSSVEDSMILLGPPRSGKGLHTVIGMILDAPGAVVT